MGITLHIDSALLPFTGGISTIEVNGKTVNECVDDLRKRLPELERLFDPATGKVWSDVSVYLNRIGVTTDQPVKDGDELTIVVGIAGG